MELAYILKGILVGISVSIPLGPVGILCMNKTLNKGPYAGFLVGVGAALADTFYAILAGFGISIIVNFLMHYQDIFKIIGGSIVLLIGFRLVKTGGAFEMRRKMYKQEKGVWGGFLTAFAIVLSNPVGLIVFGGVFAGFGLVNPQSDSSSVTLLILGVLLGALIWWIILSFLVSVFKDKFNIRRLYWANKFSGFLIIILGAAIVLSVFVNIDSKMDNEVISQPVAPIINTINTNHQ